MAFYLPSVLSSLPPMVEGKVMGKFYLSIGQTICPNSLENIDGHAIQRIGFRVKFFGDNSTGILMRFI